MLRFSFVWSSVILLFYSDIFLALLRVFCQSLSVVFAIDVCSIYMCNLFAFLLSTVSFLQYLSFIIDCYAVPLLSSRIASCLLETTVICQFYTNFCSFSHLPDFSGLPVYPSVIRPSTTAITCSYSRLLLLAYMDILSLKYNLQYNLKNMINNCFHDILRQLCLIRSYLPSIIN